MAFEQTLAELEKLAEQDRLAARQFLQNILDTVQTQVDGVITPVTADITALTRAWIPSTATQALAVFDKFAQGVQVPIEDIAQKEVALAILHAKAIADTLIPDGATASPNAPAAQKSETETVQVTAQKTETEPVAETKTV